MTNMKKQEFPILGMGCAACAARVEQALWQHKGVTEAAVNFAAQTAMVQYDSNMCTPDMLRQAVQAAGYDMVVEADSSLAEAQAAEAHHAEWANTRRRAIPAALLALLIWGIQMFCPATLPYALLMWTLSTPVVLWFGRGFFISAARQLRHRSAGMDMLVATGTGVAYIYSTALLLVHITHGGAAPLPHLYFESASMIVTFVLAGRLLEARAKSHTTDSLRGLMTLRPQTATATDGKGNTWQKSIHDIQSGDLLLAKAGEHIAADGTITDGTSHVDESMLSGECIPVSKHKGDRVYAGTTNQHGSLVYRADSVGDHTLLAQIIRMVREAQGSKAPVQQLADKVAAVFVPVIMALSLLTLLAWGIFGGSGGWEHGLTAAVSVLVVACPCALGLATPTAITVGIGRAAREGILVQDAAALEEARLTDTIILDKTGTLTTGHPTVTECCWADGAESLASIVMAMEEQSAHPLAEAIRTYTKGTLAQEICEASHVSDFITLPGMGVEGAVGGVRYMLGNMALLQSRGITLTGNMAEAYSRMTGKGCSVVLFADSQSALAVIGISDPLKATSRQGVSELQAMGIGVYMLTGDNSKAAAAVAQAAGISHYKANVLPADKAAFISELQASGHHVGMAGDGINDSAALATANLSIAMGQGSDIAIDVAMLTIMQSDIRLIARAIQLSRITTRIIRQNLFWAFFYNVIAVPVAAGALYPLCGLTLNPMYASMAMALSSVSVVANSLRINRAKS